MTLRTFKSIEKRLAAIEIERAELMTYKEDLASAAQSKALEEESKQASIRGKVLDRLFSPLEQTHPELAPAIREILETLTAPSERKAFGLKTLSAMAKDASSNVLAAPVTIVGVEASGQMKRQIADANHAVKELANIK